MMEKLTFDHCQGHHGNSRLVNVHALGRVIGSERENCDECEPKVSANDPGPDL